MSEEYKEGFDGKRILITGGLGFIGSTLARTLAGLKQPPESIVLVDALVPGLGGNINEDVSASVALQHYNLSGLNGNIRVYSGEEGDMRNKERMLNILEAEKPEFIFNIAGSVSHIGSKDNPSFDFEHNLKSHIHFLDACRDYSKKHPGRKIKVGYAGTRDQLGKVPERELPVDERFVVNNIADPQGINKQAAEFYHRWFSDHGNFPFFSLRLVNVYGPRHIMNDSGQGVVNWFVTLALEGKPIKLWDGGKFLRDFNYVDDTVEAFMRGMVSEKANNQIYNLGASLKVNGYPEIIGENVKIIGGLADLIIKEAGNGSFISEPYPKGRETLEPGHFSADICKIHSDLEWIPRTSLKEGIKKTLEFYKEPANREIYWKK
ncbi:MAG: NAD-dependent epimerase/dehydratase family protein [archaeon]|nr:NAD-dependent epimerase/dehydratase family protein [archaeon]